MVELLSFAIVVVRSFPSWSKGWSATLLSMQRGKIKNKGFWWRCISSNNITMTMDKGWRLKREI